MHFPQCLCFDLLKVHLQYTNKYTIHYHVWLRNTFSIYKRKSYVLLYNTNRIGKDTNKLLNVNDSRLIIWGQRKLKSSTCHIRSLMKYKLQINPFPVNRENDWSIHIGLIDWLFISVKLAVFHYIHDQNKFTYNTTPR